MNLTRRMAIASCLLAAARPAYAIKPAVPSSTVHARLRPGGPALELRAVAEQEPQRRVVIRAAGPGAPAGTVLLPSHYGGVFAMEAMPLRGRDAVLTWMDGLGGTGVSQRIGVVIAVDDADRLRIIGLETTDGTESGTCTSEAAFHARLAAAGTDRLRLGARYRRTPLPCGRPLRGRPQNEAWEDVLAWDGRGALTGAQAPAGAGPVRRATAEARAKVAAFLAQEPVTDLTGVDLEALGLFAVVTIGAAR